MGLRLEREGMQSVCQGEGKTIPKTTESEARELF